MSAVAYLPVMTDRAMLPRRMRLALQAAIREVVDREGSQIAAAEVLGVSQPAVGKAVNRAEVGPTIDRKVRDYYGLPSEADFLARFGAGAAEPTATLDIDHGDPIPERAHAAALARQAGADERAVTWARDVDISGQSTAWWLGRIMQKHGELALTSTGRDDLAKPRAVKQVQAITERAVAQLRASAPPSVPAKPLPRR